MASVKKFCDSQIDYQIRHIERTVEKPTNEDINKEKLNECYFLSPDRGVTNYDYYLQRKSECYLYGRDDVKTAFGWVITAPEDVKEGQEDLFFCVVYEFLCQRYGGEKNVLSCTVHKDESGRPHMHFIAMPIVEDKKRGGEKFCANDVLTRADLRNFHPDLQRYLKANGVSGTVMTGITKRQGGNRTVAELKASGSRNVEQTQTRSRWRSHEITY